MNESSSTQQHLGYLCMLMSGGFSSPEDSLDENYNDNGKDDANNDDEVNDHEHDNNKDDKTTL